MCPVMSAKVGPLNILCGPSWAKILPTPLCANNVGYNLSVNFDKYICSSHKLVKSMLYRFCSMFVLF